MTEPTPDPRHYLAALVDGGGTVPAELGVVRRLVERGHTVTVLGEDSMAADVAATGAELRPWVEATNRPTRRPEHDPIRDWECKGELALFRRFLERQIIAPAPAYAREVVAEIERRRPDRVLCNLFAYGALAGAESTGVPFDVLHPNLYPLPRRGMPPFGSGLRPARTPVGRGMFTVLDAMTMRLWQRGLEPLNELRRDLGLDEVDNLFDQVHRADRQLVLSAAAFELPWSPPPQIRVVGPVLDDPTWASTEAWEPPPGDEPLVLVGLSSTYQDHTELLQRVIDALATLPVRGVVTTGPAVDPEALRPAASVQVVRAAPHSEVLAHADAVVTHGGHGTVMRALAAGVPLVVLPHGRDQGDNAVRVTTHGAGLRLKRTASTARLARAVATVLDDGSIGQAAQHLGSAIRAEADSGALLAALEDLPDVAPNP